MAEETTASAAASDAPAQAATGSETASKPAMPLTLDPVAKTETAASEQKVDENKTAAKPAAKKRVMAKKKKPRKPQVAYSNKDVRAVIDLAEQRMHVYIDGDHEYTWKVSTARAGYITPTGYYRPQWLARMHYSRKYDNSPMPYSVFYDGGFAIHGTNSISRLGRPASHGCVRLHPNNAKKLFNLVRKHGKGNTQIVITGAPPRGRNYVRVKVPNRPSYWGRADDRSSRTASTSDCRACEGLKKFTRPFSLDTYDM